MAKKQELVKASTGFLATQDEQNYLPEKLNGTGLGNLGKGDFKTPRIILLQGLSPQRKQFDTAKDGHFWHTGTNTSLGDEFYFVPATCSKKVILWRPRWDGDGGILALSMDAISWDYGGNTRHEVVIDKNGKKRAIWDTGKNVPTSGLTRWGTFDPEDDDSGPAAQEIYEYMCYLPERPVLSPVLFGVQRTGLPNARTLNTTLLSWTKQWGTINNLAVRCFSEERAQDGNSWFVPNFEAAGRVNESVYKEVKKIAEEYRDFVATDYEQPMDVVVEGDKIAY